MAKVVLIAKYCRDASVTVSTFLQTIERVCDADAERHSTEMCYRETFTIGDIAKRYLMLVEPLERLSG